MATATTQPRMTGGRGGGGEDDEVVKHGLRPVHDDGCNNHGVVLAREANKQRAVSRLAVEGGSSGGGRSVDMRSLSAKPQGNDDDDDAAGHGRRSWGRASATTLPPPHAWLAMDDTKTNKKHPVSDEDQWTQLLCGGGGGGRHHHHHHHPQQNRRSSFSVVRRERAAREAWLDRAWEMKRSWHERNGGAPDADTPVVVVVGGGTSSTGSSSCSSLPPSSDHHHHHHHAGGVAMDVEEVRACRDLGLELPSDCTVEIQCYGLSGGDTSPSHAGSHGSGADSPCGGAGGSSHGADPTDVKARLKVWAHAVALASTTQLGS